MRWKFCVKINELASETTGMINEVYRNDTMTWIRISSSEEEHMWKSKVKAMLIVFFLLKKCGPQLILGFWTVSNRCLHAQVLHALGRRSPITEIFTRTTPFLVIQEITDQILHCNVATTAIHPWFGTAGLPSLSKNQEELEETPFCEL